MRQEELDPKTKRQNRILAAILAVIVLGIVAYAMISIYNADIRQGDDTGIYGTEQKSGE